MTQVKLSKAEKVRKVLEATDWDDRRIAKKVGCSVPYVNMIRNGKRVGIPKAATGVDAVLDERGSRYGAFVNQAMVGQSLKHTVFLGMNEQKKHLAYPDYCVVNEALEMICVKMARILNGDPLYADNWVDIAGYAKLVADHLEGKSR